MNDICFCCFIEIPVGDTNPGTATWKLPDGGKVVTSDLSICTACRRLGCDVLRPGGCKRPEALAGEMPGGQAV